MKTLISQAGTPPITDWKTQMHIRTLMAAVAATAFLGAPALAHDHGKTKAASVTEVGDIVDVAVANGSFTTLVTVVQAAGLVDTLKGDGPFTVFAPTDDAFAALPDGTLESLLAEEGLGTLTTILTYHVVPGKVKAGDIAGKTLEADTAAGIKLPIDATDGVTVGNATVTAADVMASNGVIHVVDAVILPPSTES